MDHARNSNNNWGAWGTQSAKRPTLDFGSGPDLTVHELEPRVGFCAESAESAWDSLSLSLPLSAPPMLVVSLSLSLSLSK